MVRKDLYDAGQARTLESLRGLRLALTPPGVGSANACALSTALEKSRGNVGRCADLCGLSRRSVSGKISQYTIDKYPFKSS